MAKKIKLWFQWQKQSVHLDSFDFAKFKIFSILDSAHQNCGRPPIKYTYPEENDFQINS